MKDELPDVDGLWLDRDGDVWRRRGSWMGSDALPEGGYDVRDEDDRARLQMWGPYRRLVAFDEEELAELHDYAVTQRDVSRSLAAHIEAHGATQQQVTAELIRADWWRAIAEKTGAE